MYVSLSMKYLEKDKFIDKESRSVFVWIWHWESGMITNGLDRIWGSDGNVLKPNCGNGCTTMNLF